MHFGRSPTDPEVDLSLPAVAPRTEAFFKVPWHGRGQLYVGLPIWSCTDWVGSFYPDRSQSKDFLGLYSSRLNTVEVNSTFYHLLDAGRIKAWRDAVPTSFRFCPKVFRGITEAAGSPDLPALVHECATNFQAFGETFGLAFAQFPETFSTEHAKLLKRFLGLWPRNLNLAVELRHPSWFESQALLDDAINLLYRHGTATVITDTPGRRNVLHTSLTQPRVLVRFQGQDLHANDQARLTAWSERLLDWAGRGMEDLYFFCHQPTEKLIPRTANLLLLALQMRGRVEPAPWSEKRKQDADQRSSAIQSGLFS